MRNIKVKETENQIQNTICDYLALKKYFFWRQNTAPSVQISGDKWHFRRMGKYAMRGVPDIIIVLKSGAVFFLEVKSKTGTQSDGQKEFERLCKLNNAPYAIVRSLDDVKMLGL